MKKEYGFGKIELPDYWPEISAANTPPDDCPTCHGSKTAWNEQYAEYLACPDCVGLCPVCLNQGFVTPAVPYTDPAFGKAIPCPTNCKVVQQFAETRKAGIMRYSAIPAEYQKLTFETFRQLAPADYAGKLKAYHAAWLFAHNEGCAVDKADVARAMSVENVTSDIRNWIVLHGAVGTAKTGLLAAVIHVLSERGVKVRYIRLPDLIEAVQKRYSASRFGDGYDDEFENMSSSDVLMEVKTSPVLGIDEFDIRSDAKGGELSADVLKIVDKLIRYRHGEQLPTFITTNLSPDAFNTRWGAGIYDVVKQRAHFIPVTGVGLRRDSGAFNW